MKHPETKEVSIEIFHHSFQKLIILLTKQILQHKTFNSIQCHTLLMKKKPGTIKRITNISPLLTKHKTVPSLLQKVYSQIAVYFQSAISKPSQNQTPQSSKAKIKFETHLSIAIIQ